MTTPQACPCPNPTTCIHAQSAAYLGQLHQSFGYAENHPFVPVPPGTTFYSYYPVNQGQQSTSSNPSGSSAPNGNPPNISHMSFSIASHPASNAGVQHLPGHLADSGQRPPLVAVPNGSQGQKRQRTNSNNIQSPAQPKRARTSAATAKNSTSTSTSTSTPAAYGIGPIAAGAPSAGAVDASAAPPAAPTPPNPDTTASPSARRVAKDKPATPAARRFLPRNKRTPARKPRGRSDATDVWYHLRALPDANEPSVKPDPETEPTLSRKPKSAYVGCKLCVDSWVCWKNGDGMTTTIRSHLQSKHKSAYEEAVTAQGLKKTDEAGANNKKAAPRVRVPFSSEGLTERIAKFVVSDDQSINVVENPYFRDLLLFLREDLEQADIAHRTKLTEDILRRCDAEYKTMVEDMKHSLGRISVTSDIWTDKKLQSYMAVTAHYCATDEFGRLVLRSRLIAFRHLTGAHSGRELARVLLGIFDEAGIAGRIGFITLDNASNNNTLMAELRKGMGELGFPFHEDENRIRCFPHVVNIAVQTALKRLTSLPPQPPTLETEAPLPESYVVEDEEDITNTLNELIAMTAEEYAAALLRDPVSLCRTVVKACRASGQRREELQKVISEGNLAGGFEGEPLREVQLLTDCETRWSSTFNMIDRFVELYPAIERFLLLPKQREIWKCMLSEQEIAVLKDIRQILRVAHVAQEILSAEKTPTLALAIPTYELMVEKWIDLKEHIPELAHVIDAAVSKIQEYLKKARSAKIYMLAMFINPIYKLQWMEEHWSAEEVEEARKTVKEAMLEYRTAARRADSARVSVPRGSAFSAPAPSSSALQAAQAQKRGTARLRDLDTHHRSSKVISPSGISSSLPTNRTPQSEPAAMRGAPELLDEETRERMALERDRAAVAREFDQYIDDGLIPDDGTFEIMSYWQTQSRVYPFLFRVALDILPAQASAVACERVFSSSKETFTDRRTRTSTALMEARQILKYILNHEPLSFTSGWLASEQEFGVGLSSPEVMPRAGKFSEMLRTSSSD